MTTHNQNSHKKPAGDDDDIIITDAQVREVFPTEEEKYIQGKPLTESEVEEAIGGDMPVDGIALTNMNNEDEEVEKEADII
jgi:hypothetical protein